ncbi:hypothetical protein ACIRLA_46540 [Streptomyces sp. NPDC102364]|uniref:hypothetical protein n=1 Tax=Streptomyces sp. NPDC102364 TaxID=3366161 RepID=UPI0037F3D078
MHHRKGMCPECAREVATTSAGRVWRHDHAAKPMIVCPGKGRPAVDLIPRQLEIPAEQLRLVDLVDNDGNLVAFGVPAPRSEDDERAREADGLFTL